MRFSIKLLFVVLITPYTIIYSQLKDNFTKGSIELLNGEKKHGYIKNESILELSKDVTFKSQENDPNFDVYNTSNLKSFTTDNGLKFDRLKLKVNNNSDEIIVFADLILEGKASLYKSYYNSKVIFIIAKDNLYYVLQNDEISTTENELIRYNYLGILYFTTETSSENSKTINYNEANFIKVITNYNKSLGSESKLHSSKEKPISFIIVYGGTGKAQYGTTLFFHGFYKTYFPSISRKTSLNFGLEYYNEKIKYFDIYNNKINTTGQFFTLPIQIQQNFSTKAFRPYLIAGLSLTYFKFVEQNNTFISKSDQQKSFGLAILYGGGIEFDIYKGFTSKIEYRNEQHEYLVFGLGYNFSK